MNQLPRSIDEHIKYLQQKGLSFPDKEAATDLFSRVSYSRLKYYWRDLIEVISLMRNIVAHYSRLWNRSLGKKIIDPKGRRNTWLNGEFTEIQKKKPYAVICAIAYLCKAVNFQHGFPNAIKHLCSVYPNIPLAKYGFPVRWEKEPLWR